MRVGFLSVAQSSAVAILPVILSYPRARSESSETGMVVEVSSIVPHSPHVFVPPLQLRCNLSVATILQSHLVLMSTSEDTPSPFCGPRGEAEGLRMWALSRLRPYRPTPTGSEPSRRTEPHDDDKEQGFSLHSVAQNLMVSF